MVGQWAGDPQLIAQEEFEQELVEGWTCKKKRKAGTSGEGEKRSKASDPEVIDLEAMVVDN
jgi:hypothetical protein